MVGTPAGVEREEDVGGQKVEEGGEEGREEQDLWR